MTAQIAHWGEKIQAVVRQVSVSADIVVFKSELFLKLAAALQRKIHSSPLHFLTAHLAVSGGKIRQSTICT